MLKLRYVWSNLFEYVYVEMLERGFLKLLVIGENLTELEHNKKMHCYFCPQVKQIFILK